jgi:hypothetical protein
MNILDAIINAQGGGAVTQIGQQLGLRDDQVTAALGALVPALAAGFERNASSPEGLESLLGALTGGRHARYVDDVTALGQDATLADGNGILGHIFGSKDVSREVASRAAAQTGLGADVLKRLLPIAAALMMGAMSKQSMPAGRPGAAAGADLLGMLAPVLDRNRDGSMIDDVLGMVGRVLGSRS